MPADPNYSQDAFYVGDITNVVPSEDQQGNPQLLVEVEIKGQLKNARDPNAGIIATDPITREVRLTFATGQQSDIALETLLKLGLDKAAVKGLFSSPDALKGKRVTVQPTHKEGKRGSVTYWNFRTPFTPRSTNADVAKSKLEERFAEYEQAKANQAVQPAGSPF